MVTHGVAVIVAGGKSSRMQQDKALLPFGGFSSLAEFQYRRLVPLFSKVYLSAKAHKFNFEVEIITDRYSISSPLVALISIFETLDNVDEVFVLSVDAPFVPKSVIDKLYQESNPNIDIVIATSQRGIEPLCAIYHRSFLSRAKAALANNEHRLQSLFEGLRIKEVLIEEDSCFMNLNYPVEYKEAKSVIEKE